MNIPFSFETKYGLFSDELIFPDEEGFVFSEEEIEQMKQERLTSWLAVIEAPQVIEPEVIEPEVIEPQVNDTLETPKEV